jgi:hypothetical protein
MKTKKKINKKLVLLKEYTHRHVKLALFPHKVNQYRPHLIRHHGLAMIALLLLISTQTGYTVAATGRALGAKESISVEVLLRDTNVQRVDNKLPALAMNSQLSRAASLKAQDMLNEQYWAHVSPQGVTPWHWFGVAGYDYSYAGENLAKNFSSADAVTLAWMASPEHRANILDTHYTQVGFAVVDGIIAGKPTSLIVALYGEPAAATAGVATAQILHSETAAGAGSLSLMTRFGVALQSVTPAALSSVVLIIIVVGVALLAHAYRKKLPASFQRTRYRHHGLVKAGGMISLCFVILFLYSGGQI